MTDIAASLVSELQEGSREQLLHTIRELRAQLRQQGDQLAAQQRRHTQRLQGLERLQQAVGAAVRALGNLPSSLSEQQPPQQQQKQVQAVTEQLRLAHCTARDVLTDCQEISTPAEAAAVPPVPTVAAVAGGTAAGATTATAAATPATQALGMMLQYLDLRHSSKLLCALLCTSTQLQPLIHQHCRGQLTMTVGHPLQYTRALAAGIPWISKHGCLLQQLNLRHLSLAADNAEFVAALRTAAALPGGLQLQSFISRPPSSLLLNTLSALCSSSLTSLELRSCYDAEQELQDCAPAIAGMTALRSLELSVSHLHPDRMDLLLLPSLAGLHQLTSLCIEGVHSAASLEHLPSQLQRLTVLLLSRAAADLQFELGHLTALTVLQLFSSSWEAGSVLPASLQRLTVRDCATVQPLLHLQHLQVLGLGNCRVPPLELQQLSSLQSLTDLKLLSNPMVMDFTAAATAWRVLPLRELTLYNYTAPPSASLLQQLGSCQGLTRLALDVTGVDPAAVPHFKAALCRLTQLQVVELMDGDVGQLAVAAMAAAPALRELRCCEIRDVLPVESLDSAVPHMTHLESWDCSLGESVVAAIASRCTELRRLTIPHNKGITDAALSAITQQLTQLTHLDVGFTSVTDAGVVQLSQLAWLQELLVDGTGVSAAAAARALWRGGPA